MTAFKPILLGALPGLVVGAGVVAILPRPAATPDSGALPPPTVPAIERVVTVTNTIVRYHTNSVVAVASTNAVDDLTRELSRQVAALQTELADRTSRLEAFEQAEAEREARRQQRTRGMDMEKLKQEDPERYAEIVKQRQEFGQRIKRATAERATFLMEIDTANMTEEQLANHAALQEKLAQSFDMMNKMETEGPSREMFHQMHESYETVQELYAKEREYVLSEVGRSLGYEGQDAVDFAAYINTVFEMTSARGRGPSGGRGGGR